MVRVCLPQKSNIGHEKKARLLGEADFWGAPKVPHAFGNIGKGLMVGKNAGVASIFAVFGAEVGWGGTWMGKLGRAVGVPN